MPLSLRQEQVLDLLEQGHSWRQIAIKLNVSKSSVQTYVKRIKNKMRCENE